MVNSLGGNSSQLPTPEGGGPHSKHGGVHGKQGGAKPASSKEEGEKGHIKHEGGPAAHHATIKQPDTDSASKQKLWKEDKQKQGHGFSKEDALEDSEQKVVRKDDYDARDYGGSPFGGSNVVFPEATGFL